MLKMRFLLIWTTRAAARGYISPWTTRKAPEGQTPLSPYVQVSGMSQTISVAELPMLDYRYEYTSVTRVY
jgi:hypothetical protein